MSLATRLSKIISLAEKEVSSGSGAEVLSQRIFDEATKALSGEPMIATATSTLDADAESFFANTLLALGAEKGIWLRLKAEHERRFAGRLPQVAAYPLVDIWGRLTGIEALLMDLAQALDLACKEGCSPALIKPRMASVFDLLEFTLQMEIQELSKQADLAVLGDSLDRLMTMLKSEKHGVFGKTLDKHVNSLPA